MSVELSFKAGPYRLTIQVGRSQGHWTRARVRPSRLLPAPLAMLEDRR